MPAKLTKVRTSVRLHAHRKVRGLLHGEYAAVTSGRGMDFNDLREYVRGDEVKDIDWKATARAGTPLVRRYVAVRQHTVLLVVSTGRSMAASNDVDVVKRDLAVLAGGVVGWLAVRHGDRVGVIYGDADGQHAVPLAGDDIGLERALVAVDEACTATGAPSDLAAVLGYVARTVRRRTIMLVVGDDPDLTDAQVVLLRRLAVQHEILFLTVTDADPTGAALRDRDVVDIDTGVLLSRRIRRDRRLAREYASTLAQVSAATDAHLDSLGIVHERVHDEDTVIRAVLRLLERHRHVRRR